MYQENILLRNDNLEKLDKTSKNYPDFVRYEVVEKKSKNYTEITLFYKNTAALLMASLITLK